MLTHKVLTNLFYKNGMTQDWNFERLEEYNFRFFNSETPYVPLFRTLYDYETVPISYQIIRASPYSYLGMINNTLSYNTKHLKLYKTISEKEFIVGPGQMYIPESVDKSRIIPLFITVIPNHIYKESELSSNSFEYILNNKKHYIEVMFNNNIKSINKALWKYIKQEYINLLTLERIRFTFRNPNEILDLVSSYYKKPKFSSLEELELFKKRINDEIVLKI